MNKIRTYMASLLLAFCTTGAADNFQYLTISESDGEMSYSVSNIVRITFDETNMNLLLKDGSTQSLPLANLSKMFFSQESSGMASLTTMKSKIRFAGGILRATVEAGERIAIYNMKGEQVFSANESGNYDLSGYARGVYIIKVGAETKKVINK